MHAPCLWLFNIVSALQSPLRSYNRAFLLQAVAYLDLSRTLVVTMMSLVYHRGQPYQILSFHACCTRKVARVFGRGTRWLYFCRSRSNQPERWNVHRSNSPDPMKCLSVRACVVGKTMTAYRLDWIMKWSSHGTSLFVAPCPGRGLGLPSMPTASACARIAWQTNFFANRVPVLSEKGVHGVPNLGHRSGTCQNCVVFVAIRPLFICSPEVFGGFLCFGAAPRSLHAADLCALVSKRTTRTIGVGFMQALPCLHSVRQRSSVGAE